MSRSSALCLGLLLVGCVGSRRVDLEWHTPAMCDDVGPECPLGAVRSIKTRLERVDGTVEYEGCQEAPVGLCSLADLTDFLFVARATPSDGVEIFVTGWTEPGCDDPPPEQTRGNLALGCETFGVAVIDLGEADVVPMWCDCPYVSGP